MYESVGGECVNLQWSDDVWGDQQIPKEESAGPPAPSPPADVLPPTGVQIQGPAQQVQAPSQVQATVPTTISQAPDLPAEVPPQDGLTPATNPPTPNTDAPGPVTQPTNPSRSLVGAHFTLHHQFTPFYHGGADGPAPNVTVNPLGKFTNARHPTITFLGKTQLLPHSIRAIIRQESPPASPPGDPHIRVLTPSEIMRTLPSIPELPATVPLLPFAKQLPALLFARRVLSFTRLHIGMPPLPQWRPVNQINV